MYWVFLALLTLQTGVTAAAQIDKAVLAGRGRRLRPYRVLGDLFIRLYPEVRIARRDRNTYEARGAEAPGQRTAASRLLRRVGRRGYA